MLDTSPQTSSPFSEPRFLQTLCALIAAPDLSLCENVLNFLLFHAAQIRKSCPKNSLSQVPMTMCMFKTITSGATRELMRSIGIADLLKSLGQRSGSLRVHAYSAILLTHLSLTGSSLLFFIWCFFTLTTLFECRGYSFFRCCFNVDQRASCCRHSDGLKNERSRIASKLSNDAQLSEQRKSAYRAPPCVQVVIESDSSLDAPNSAHTLEFLRFVFLSFVTLVNNQTLEDVSTGFDKQRRRICNDIISVISEWPN